MNDIFNKYAEFSLVYLDDNGLVVSEKKIKIFQTKIRFLGFEINQRTIIPISRSIEFGEKFPNGIKDNTQLQRFLGCVNYIVEFIPNIRIICAPLYKRLRKNPLEWNNEMTQVIIEIKNLVKKLSCLGISDPNANLIIETDASDIGYGGILKQKLPNSSKEQVVKYHSGIWHLSQQKYSTVKKEILSIVLCVQKFQDD
ncbi:Enzymatic polyprotein, partial [Mucuna pruriens]